MLPLRGAQKLNHLLHSSNARTLSLLLRDLPRHFSTDSQSPSQSQPPNSSTPIDPFSCQPDTGSTYGKLTGISPNTLKTDVISMFERCNLTQDDIKVQYDSVFNPLSMLVRFPSLSEFYSACRDMARKNRSYMLVKVDNHPWDLVTSHDGRHAVFRGIPRTALMDDVERFLSGCNYDASSLTVYYRTTRSGLLRIAQARFPSQIEAMNAVIRKNGAFCLNDRIVAQLIQ